MKCDEQLPVCQNCTNSKRKCYRGIRLNFNQYTIYDPKDTASAELFAVPRYFRIIDQSITILSLYTKGKDRYKRYLHLHSPGDLKEAARHFHRDTYNLHPLPEEEYNFPHEKPYIELVPGPVPVQEWQFVDHANASFKENVILENYDIKNVLMNPEGYATEGAAISVDRLPRRNLDVLPENTVSSIDVYRFIDLLQDRKYYWVLDLFNEINCWKMIVPNYCMKLAQDPEENATFLLDCLLACSDDAPMASLMANAKEQLLHWREFDFRDVKPHTIREFEIVLVSVVLTLLSLLLRATRRDFVFNDDFKILLTNQGKLFQKIVVRYTRMAEVKFRQMKRSTLTVCSFQAVVILRFLLKMQLRKVGMHYTPTAGEFDALLSSISYDAPHEPNLGEFFTFTAFEMGHLNTGFYDLDLVQLDAKLVPDRGVASDSQKLRARFWDVVKLNYLQENPEANLTLASQHTPPHGDVGRTTLIPNDKCIALNLVVLFLSKMQNTAMSEATSAKLHEIFQKINASSISRDIKGQWNAHFGWTV